MKEFKFRKHLRSGSGDLAFIAHSEGKKFKKKIMHFLFNDFEKMDVRRKTANKNRVDNKR